MGLLDGKRLLITGVLTDASLAFAVAKLAQEEGAEIVLSGAGRALSLTKRTARKLPTEPEGLEIEATSTEQLEHAWNIPAYSLKALVQAFRPLLTKAGADGGASVVGFDFDATVAWPLYDCMGVAK